MVLSLVFNFWLLDIFIRIRVRMTMILGLDWFVGVSFGLAKLNIRVVFIVIQNASDSSRKSHEIGRAHV